MELNEDYAVFFDPDRGEPLFDRILAEWRAEPPVPLEVIEAEQNSDLEENRDVALRFRQNVPIYDRNMLEFYYLRTGHPIGARHEWGAYLLTVICKQYYRDNGQHYAFALQGTLADGDLPVATLQALSPRMIWLTLECFSDGRIGCFGEEEARLAREGLIGQLLGISRSGA